MVDNLKDFLDATAGMPLVEKAFRDAEFPQKFLGGEMPEEDKVIIRRVCELIDAHTSHSDEDKESIKAAAVLTVSTITSGMMYVFDDTRRFKPGYSERVDTIVNDFLTDKLTPDMAEIMMAMAVAMGEDARRELSGSGAAEYAASLAQEAFAGPEYQLEAYDAPEFRASPALLALITKEVIEVGQLLAKFKPENSQMLTTPPAPFPQP